MKELKYFKGVLCNFYMIVLLVGLPLYTSGSYYLIGDQKYLIFRNASIICLGLWAFLSIIEVIAQIKENKKRIVKQSFLFSVEDGFMLFYLACVIVSACLSEYTKTAWFGYREWYMGAISQLLFVGIYFCVSRDYTRQSYPILLGHVAVFLVLLFAYLHKVEIDPTGLMKPYNDGDWVYSHMVSTVGNINWFSSYLGTVSPLVLCGYISGNKRGDLRKLLYLLSVLLLAMLWIQGSETGILMCITALGLCFFWGMWLKSMAISGFYLTAGMSFCIAAFAKCIELTGSVLTMPVDGNSYQKISWIGWWGIAAISLLVGMLLSKKREDTVKTILRISFLVVVVGVAFIFIEKDIVSYVKNMVMEEGNGRVTLWQLAIHKIQNVTGSQRLFGVGPDCYGEAIYTQDVMRDGFYKGATYTNAHNEWLSQLVNIGVVGTLAYFGIFVAGLIRYRKQMTGFMVLVIYGVTSLISFQEVMNAPFLFLILGMCENLCRQEKIMTIEDVEEIESINDIEMKA